MIERLKFWIINSRVFALAITFFSWLVIFVYSAKQGGNIMLGLVALVGIAMAHLATNILDDYFDYKVLSKDEKYMNSAQQCKCEFIRTGQATMNEVLFVGGFYCSIALLTGVFLAFKVGLPVVWLGVVGGIITLFYSKCSLVGLSEVAVAIAYGPLLFEGVYYVMTKTFSIEVLILSFALVFFSVGFLYSHMLLDFDGDLTSHKKTLCIRIGDKHKALRLLPIFYVLGYGTIAYFAILTGQYLYFLTYISIFWAVKSYNYMKSFNQDKTFLPEVHWYNKPLDDWSNLKNTPVASFYFRIFQSRNLMIYFALILVIVMLF
ncbi:MAG: prenyltransferase [Candidatus Gastranaerophilales bacterium]